MIHSIFKIIDAQNELFLHETYTHSMNKQEQGEEKLIIPAPVLSIRDAAVDTDTDGRAAHVLFSLQLIIKIVMTTERMHSY